MVMVLQKVALLVLLFNNAGQMIGTLTGGGASCTNRTSPDAYGKMSYHWTSNGSSSAYRLKDWLDQIIQALYLWLVLLHLVQLIL